MTRQSEQLEHEAEAARAGLETSLAELRLRLTADQIIDEAVGYVRQTPVAAFLRKLARDLQGRPMPLLLIAAGIAWAMANMRRRPHRATDMPAAAPVPPPRPAAAPVPPPRPAEPAAAPPRREWEVAAVSPAAE